MDPGLVGNCLLYVLLLPDNIYAVIFATATVENSMVSVERIHNMTTISPEDLRTRHKDEVLIKTNWPMHGCIEFQKYSTKYRPDTGIVLNSISVSIKSKEKIGIVGRTGSGKSSLVNSLFRVIEATSGRIVIDGVDIAEIGLDLLRQKLCVIPQDTALFQGKLRDNLDPFNQYSDEKIENVLKMIGFPDEYKNFAEFEVKNNGSNFSAGQKQMICIARALLRQCKIIFLDEATASIDFKTDSAIQKIIKEQFVDCTVLTIAHRINTIMNSDRIMVLDQGMLVEFDTPENLKSQNGYFCKLAYTH